MMNPNPNGQLLNLMLALPNVTVIELKGNVGFKNEEITLSPDWMFIE